MFKDRSSLSQINFKIFNFANSRFFSLLPCSRKHPWFPHQYQAKCIDFKKQNIHEEFPKVFLTITVASRVGRFTCLLILLDRNLVCRMPFVLAGGFGALPPPPGSRVVLGEINVPLLQGSVNLNSYNLTSVQKQFIVDFTSSLYLKYYVNMSC